MIEILGWYEEKLNDLLRVPARTQSRRLSVLYQERKPGAPQMLRPWAAQK